MSLLVLSPHLDDAALSCAWLLQRHPGSSVVSVFAGTPQRAALLSTRWDRDCGFASADAAIAARRREDQRACRQLDADPIWLDFADRQYGQIARRTLLKARLAPILETSGKAIVVVPLGLHHPDHIAVSDAALAVLRKLERPCIAYHEAPYRALQGVVERRIDELTAAGFSLQSLSAMGGSTTWKIRVIETYASQWPRLQIDEQLDAGNVLLPETFSTVAVLRRRRRPIRPLITAPSPCRPPDPPVSLSVSPPASPRYPGEGQNEREAHDNPKTH